MTTTAILLHDGPGHDAPDTVATLRDILVAADCELWMTPSPDEFFAALPSESPGTDAPMLFVVSALRWRMELARYAPLRGQWGYDAPARGLDRLASLVQGGCGLLAIHTAVICFDAAPVWSSLLGGAWSWERSSHPALGPVSIHTTAAGRLHPVTAALPDFEVHDEAYCDLDVATDVRPLLATTINGRTQPLVWARSVGAGRVVTSLLGHGTDSLNNPHHRAMLHGAARWASRATTSQRPSNADELTMERVDD